jgi:lycopene cyclase domain-containing protein
VTYLGFLALFVVLPILLLLLFLLLDARMKKQRAVINRSFQLGFSFLILSSLALLYTTPWDNYLVATRVWWYDPDLVLGITMGWVPLEEYLFFILQPILGGLLLLLLMSRSERSRDTEILILRVRRISFLASLVIWGAGLLNLALPVPTATYLGLELVWAVPVIMLQVAFGGDILWKRRRQLLAVILGLTVFLSFGDAIAIQSGVWTINPELSTGILLAGILPVEEFIFFLLTNLMVGFGFALIWSPESQTRLADLWRRINLRQPGSSLGNGQ